MVVVVDSDMPECMSCDEETHVRTFTDQVGDVWLCETCSELSGHDWEDGEHWRSVYAN